ncbi:MAG: hypothetical protein AAF289_17205 [Cyanobacteria bacterium P01_A01_bin.135]
MTTRLELPDLMLTRALGKALLPETVTALMNHPDIAADLLPVLHQSPFPTDYVPREIEVLFDDVTAVLWQSGQIKQQFPDVAGDYHPEIVEWLIDGETGYFSIRGMEVVNRINAMPLLDIAVLESLKEVLCKPL